MKTIFQHLSLAAAVSAALVSTQALAHQAGDLFVRAGAVTVAPDDSSDGLVVPALDGVNGFDGTAAIGGTGVEVDDDTQLGLTVTYMLSNSLGVELLAATPFTHDITANLGGLGKVDAGETTHLPPTLSVVWYPMGSSNQISPYVGAGINYTVFFEEEVSADLEAGLPAVADALTGTTVGLSGPVPMDLELDNSLGLAFQAGVDVALDEKWHLNASVRWIDIETKGKITSALGDTITVDDVTIDPFVYQINLGYKF